MKSIINLIALTIATQLATVALVASAGAVVEQGTASLAAFDSPALKIISDEDQNSLQQIKYHIDQDFVNFRSINEVHAFLDKVKLLVQKHPKNVAFAQGDLKELLKFLSQEIVTRLIRVDTEPFIMPLSDDKVPYAQRAVDEDELTRKLFGGPLRSFIEAKRQQVSRNDDGNHKDGNFFANIWCKITGSCSNQ